MKVLHIETGRHLYGGAFQVCYLLEGLVKAGIENVLVCTRGSGIAAAAAPYATVEAIPMRGELDILFPLRLRRLIRHHRPDIIHVHSRRGADLWGGLVARSSRTPSVITRRVDNPEWPPFARYKYAGYDRVVTISEGIRKVLLSEGVPPDRVTCIHSVVRAEQYRHAPDRGWFAEQFGVPADAPVIGVIAQLIRRKGHAYLLDITPRLLERFPGLRIVFFGQGPLCDELKAYVSSHGLGRQVIFAGFRDDMPQVLPCLDLVVHPALMEGLGVSLLQAAAAGVPIVGTRAGGIPEIVRDGVNGRLVEPGDREGLYEAVSELLASSALKRQFGAAGRELVQQEFSVDHMVARYRELYGDLVSR